MQIPKTKSDFTLFSAIAAKMAVSYNQMGEQEAATHVNSLQLSEPDLRLVEEAHRLLLADCPPGGPDTRREPMWYLEEAKRQAAAHSQA